MTGLPLRAILGPVRKIESPEPVFCLADFLASIPPEILDQIERLNSRRRIVNNQVIEFDERLAAPISGLEVLTWPELRLDGFLAIRDGAARFLVLKDSLKEKGLSEKEIWERLLVAAQRGVVSWPNFDDIN